MWRSPATFFVDFDMEKKHVPLKIASTLDIVVYAGQKAHEIRSQKSEAKKVANASGVPA